ncbi:glycosyl transferase [bacterium]|nr:MAG: glycosyl transferase [bacterium]
MKKILFIHTFYQNKGGEDIAVENELNLLKEVFEVETLFFSNNIKNYFLEFFSFVLNRNIKNQRLLNQKISEFQPDIVYVHNTWFAASLGIFDVLKKRDVKVLLKLHNLRFNCTRTYLSKKHFENDNICLCCGKKREDLGFFNKYFEESFLKSLYVTRYGKKYFKILNEMDLTILVLTSFHKKFLESLSIKNKIEIFPNYIDVTKNTVKRKNLPYLVYAGRISQEKGVEELIHAFLNSGMDDYKLKIIGNGPLLKSLLDIEYENIEFLGEVENQEVLKIIQNSLCVITATKLYEGQPTLLCEASSLGVPSIFPNTGGISEFFPRDYSLTFEQFNYKDLESKIRLIRTLKNQTSIGEENKEFIFNHLDKNNLISSFTHIVQND